VAEMAIGRRWADASLPGRLGEGEAGGTLLRNEVEGGADQRFAQIAVMIAAPPAAAVSRPAHAPGLAHSGERDINRRGTLVRLPAKRRRAESKISSAAAKTDRARWRPWLRAGIRAEARLGSARPLAACSNCARWQTCRRKASGLLADRVGSIMTVPAQVKVEMVFVVGIVVGAEHGAKQCTA